MRVLLQLLALATLVGGMALLALALHTLRTAPVPGLWFPLALGALLAGLGAVALVVVSHD